MLVRSGLVWSVWSDLVSTPSCRLAQDLWFSPSSNAEEGAAPNADAAPATAAAGTGRVARAANGSAAATLAGLHSDVCEVSMNVALRTAGLVGTRVGFVTDGAPTTGLPRDGRPLPAPDATSCGEAQGVEEGAEQAGLLWLEHTPTHAFINLCAHRHGVEPMLSGSRDTLVIRGFASSFRRAPAEGWHEACTSTPKAQ